jgi:hypothetical protein
MATLEWSPGRFGNQLHLIAATYALSKDMNEPCEIPSWQYAEFFPNYNKYITTKENAEFKHYYNEVQRFPDAFPHRETDLEEYFQQIPKKPKTKLRGYFESAMFFKGAEKEIKDLFAIPVPKHKATGIHVRRADFLWDADPHVQLTMDYYQTAIKHLKDDRYIICSDDVAWCKENFTGPQFEFPEGTMLEDFRTLIGCERLIIANSTFSWWAGYLIEEENVIAPRTWHKHAECDWHKYANTKWKII